MSKMLIILSVFLSINAFAHVEPGNYVGKDQNGNTCSFTVGDMWFEADMHHPLTERLPVSEVEFSVKAKDAFIWNLGHPPVVNTTVGTNRYNHDIFQQIVPSKVGANSVTLLKNAEESEAGHKPVGIIYIEDNYRKVAESKHLTCLL